MNSNMNHSINTSALSAAQSIRSKQALVVLGCALGMGGGFAALYFSTLGIFLKPLSEEFAWGRAQTSAATVLSMLGMAIGAILVGRLIDRMGAKRVLGGSICLMAGLTAMMSQLQGNVVHVAALSFAIGFVGVATTPLGYLAVLTRWFEGRLGLALGVSMMGLGIGTVVFPIVAQAFISQWGWRGAYMSLALVALGLGAVAWFLLFVMAGAPPSVQTINETAQTVAPESEGETLKQAMRSPRYWGIVVILFLVSAAGLGAVVHTAAFLTDSSISKDMAAKAVALSGLGVVLGRLIAGALMDKYSAARVGAAAFLLGGIGLSIMASVSPTLVAMLMLGVFLAGFAIGAEGDFIPFIVRRYFGMRSFGTIYGTLFGVYALGGLAGPIAFGVSFDRMGSYSPAFTVAAAACVAGAIATLFLGKYRFASPKAL